MRVRVEELADTHNRRYSRRAYVIDVLTRVFARTSLIIRQALSPLERKVSVWIHAEPPMITVPAIIAVLPPESFFSAFFKISPPIWIRVKDEVDFIILRSNLCQECKLILKQVEQRNSQSKIQSKSGSSP